MGRMLTIGRVTGHRGTSGELTVRVVGGSAAPWLGVKEVAFISPDGSRESRTVERARGYRDRLVLKLVGVDDAGAAAAFRGRSANAAAEELGDPGGSWSGAWLVDLPVIDDATGRVLGRVEAFRRTAGPDLLVLRGERGEEVLVPLTEPIVRAVDPAGGSVRVTLPEGLWELNPEVEK